MNLEIPLKHLLAIPIAIIVAGAAMLDMKVMLLSWPFFYAIGIWWYMTRFEEAKG